MNRCEDYPCCGHEKGHDMSEQVNEQVLTEAECNYFLTNLRQNLGYRAFIIEDTMLRHVEHIVAERHNWTPDYSNPHFMCDHNTDECEVQNALAEMEEDEDW